jgi:hypothetical protein
MSKFRIRSGALPGAVFLLVGAWGLILSTAHAVGADREIVLRFPRLILASLLVIGAVTLVRDIWRGGAAPWHFPLRPLFVISGSVLAFAGLIETAGLLPAAGASVAIGAFGFQGARWREVLVLATLLSVAIAAIFVGLLNQPMRLITGF